MQVVNSNQSNHNDLICEKTEMLRILENQKKAYLNDPYPSVAVRENRISRVIDLLVDNEYKLCEAVQEDYGRRHIDATRMQEIMAPIGSLKYARKHVKKWLKRDKRKSSFPFNLMGADSYVKHVPLGVVGNVSPWNFPVALSLGPLGGILAGGNRVILKPSELTPATSSVLAETIRERFEEDEIAVILGGPETASIFTSLPFDHLLFTGSTTIGQCVMRSAAENLVPTTLELGGKSPVFIAEDIVDIDSVAQKIAFAKTANAGQICIAPDYILLTEKHREPFIKAYSKAINAMFAKGENSEFLTNIISEKHSQRLKTLLEESESSGNRVISLLESNDQNSDPRCVAPMIVEVQNPDCRLMKEEIFGPLLPIVPVQNTQQAVEFINDKSKPLALYLFSKNNALIETVSNEVACGGMVVNDLLLHFLQDDMPFGGVGASGIGAYHGVEGFKQFTHAKSVFKAPGISLSKFLKPPYGNLYRQILKHEISK